MLQKRTIIQQSGAVQLPAEFLEKHGLKAGDEVAYFETEDGLFISSREALVDRLLDDLESGLTAKDISLEVLIDSGREERAALLRELYGIDG